MERGEAEVPVVKMAVEAGIAIPEEFANAPQLMAGLELYYDAYLDLLPWLRDGYFSMETVVTYCAVNDIQGQQLADMLTHMPAMAAAHRKHIANQQPPPG